MREKINLKVLAIIIVIIALVGLITFFVINVFNQNKNKSYELEIIEEAECKYFPVYSNGKYGVIDIEGNMIIENKYKNMIVPNPTKDVFIAVNDDGSTAVFNKNGETIYAEYNKVNAIKLNEIDTTLPYEKSVLQYEENRKIWINKLFR